MAETKNSILQRAKILFFKYGIKSVTMDDISHELGISKKTLYQFFENKNDLLAQMLQAEEEKDIEMTNKSLAESSDAIDELLLIARHVIEELGKLMNAQRVLYDLQKYYREIWEKFEEGMNERVYLVTKNNIERGKREGLYRDEIDADIISRLYVNKIFCVMDEDTFPIRQYDKLRLFKQHLIYHIHGIATANGLQLLDKRLAGL